MKEQEELIGRLTALISPILHDLGLELVEVQLAGGVRYRIVRAYIDKPDGVTIDDCTAVSRRFSLELDNAELIDGSYTLEVSSPGLDRPLVTPANFERRRGYEVRVRLKDIKKPVVGTILSANGELVLKTATGLTEIDFEKVEQGRLMF